jgi:hypothetical protein
MSNGAAGSLPQNRLPDAASVLIEMTLVPRSGAVAHGAAPAPAGAPTYRILRTLEVDEYEDPVPPAEVLALASARPPPTDNVFRGTARRAAKLSIADANMEAFADLNALIGTLQDHATMVAHPGISTKATNNRVAEEKRNVRVKAFLYAASREDDNDFHLIIGRDPAKPAKYMTVEISGLPPSNSVHFAALKEARDAYFEFFGDRLPGAPYDFYDPPIPVDIEGSLFFDASHAQGGRPGPAKLRPKMPVVWEVHPVARIVFEP